MTPRFLRVIRVASIAIATWPGPFGVGSKKNHGLAPKTDLGAPCAYPGAATIDSRKRRPMSATTTSEARRTAGWGDANGALAAVTRVAGVIDDLAARIETVLTPSVSEAVKSPPTAAPGC
jgi:hypothetical protein